MSASGWPPRAQIGIAGRVIRTHGDYHLGQTLYTPRGWVIIDFEGEPARPLSSGARSARRCATWPACCGRLRTSPPRRRCCAASRCRRTSSSARRSRSSSTTSGEVDPTLLPAGEAAVTNLLSIYELEKAIYELRYELDNRPDWISIPVAGISRLLEAE